MLHSNKKMLTHPVKPWSTELFSFSCVSCRGFKYCGSKIPSLDKGFVRANSPRESLLWSTRFSNGTNSLSYTLLYRQNFWRVHLTGMRQYFRPFRPLPNVHSHSLSAEFCRNSLHLWSWWPMTDLEQTGTITMHFVLREQCIPVERYFQLAYLLFCCFICSFFLQQLRNIEFMPF